MILPGLPIPLATKAAAIDLYSIISGGDQGFVKEDGVLNNLGGIPASGSDQGTLLDGFVVDAIANLDGFNVFFQGDATASLSNLSSVIINEDEFFVEEVAYDAEFGLTSVFLGDNFPFVDGVTYTVELVFA